MLLPFDFRKDTYPLNASYVVLDFSATNPDLATLNLTDTATFSDYVFGKIREAGAQVGVGGYNEHRVIYRRSDHFATDDEPREIHLGIDFWAAAGTPVYAPMAGVVHSFRDNAHFGDYGPTLILEHTVDGKPLYSLYGHLTRSSLDGLYVGKRIEENEPIAQIGPYPENGDWPPHLHFQLMTDMLGNEGDFPGVCSIRDRAKFLAICPNPNDILTIPGL